MSQQPLKIIINPEPLGKENITLPDNTSTLSLPQTQSKSLRHSFNVLLKLLRNLLTLPIKLLVIIIQATLTDLVKTVFATLFFIALLLTTTKHITPSQLPSATYKLFRELTNSISYNQSTLESIKILLKSAFPHIKESSSNNERSSTNTIIWPDILTDTSQVVIRFDTTTPSIFYCEVARSDSKRQIGLMYRSKIPDNYCMIFVFKTPVLIPFWMKNVEIPLDIIFLNSDLRIMQIYKNLSPCLKRICPAYAPDEQFQYVIEIKGGLSEKLGITQNTTVELKLQQ